MRYIILLIAMTLIIGCEGDSYTAGGDINIGNESESEWELCPACKGDDSECAFCDGAGVI